MAEPAIEGIATAYVEDTQEIVGSETYTYDYVSGMVGVGHIRTHETEPVQTIETRLVIETEKNEKKSELIDLHFAKDLLRYIYEGEDADLEVIDMEEAKQRVDNIMNDSGGDK